MNAGCAIDSSKPSDFTNKSNRNACGKYEKLQIVYIQRMACAEAGAFDISERNNACFDL